MVGLLEVDLAVVLILIFAAISILFRTRVCLAGDTNSIAAHRLELRGTIKDSLGRPIAGAEVRLLEGGHAIARLRTDSAGAILFKSLAPGSYSVVATKQGYRQALQTIVLSSKKRSAPLIVTMEAKEALTLQLATARLDRARNDLSTEIGATAYHFDQPAIHKLPEGQNTNLAQVLQQAPGVSQDSYAQGQEQIHIHGENGGGVQYRINDIFMPEAVTSFGEIFSPRFVHSITLLTGVLPAEIGYRPEGVIDIRTKDGCIDGGPDNDNIEMYGGQRETVQPSFELGGCKGRFSYYVSGYLRAHQSRAAVADRQSRSESRLHRSGAGIRLPVVSREFRNAAVVGDRRGGEFIRDSAGAGARRSSSCSRACRLIRRRRSKRTSSSRTTMASCRCRALIGEQTQLPAGGLQPVLRAEVQSRPDRRPHLQRRRGEDSATGFINGVQEDTSYKLDSQHTLRAGFYMSGEAIELDDHAQTFPATDGMQTSTIPISIVDDNNQIAWLLGFYLQDEWHPTEKLTINCGVAMGLDERVRHAESVQPAIRSGIRADARHDSACAAMRATSRYRRSTRSRSGRCRNSRTPPTPRRSTAATTRSTRRPTTTSMSASGSASSKALNVGVDGFFKLGHNQLDLAQVADHGSHRAAELSRSRAWGSDFSLAFERDGCRRTSISRTRCCRRSTSSAGAFLADDADEISYIANHWVTLDDNQMFTGSAGASYKLWGFLLTVDAIWGSGYRRGFANSGELPPILQFNAADRARLQDAASRRGRMAPEHDQRVRPHLPNSQRHRHRRILAVIRPSPRVVRRD